MSDTTTRKDPVQRYEDLFNGTPIHGGEEWKLSLEEIEEIFLAAAIEGVRFLAEKSEIEFLRHQSLSWGRRKWEEMRGWKEPEAVTLGMIHGEMAARCRQLAHWMSGMKYSSFYMGSNMSYLVDKPKLVADFLDSQS